MLIKNCLNCKKEFRTYPSNIKKGKGKYCSRFCASKNTLNGFKKGHKTNLGKKRPNMEWVKGKNSWIWKGDNVGYHALHVWIIKNFGQPDVCEFCDAKDLSGRQINWANKDHKYSRNREDWLRLCKSCHSAYDQTWLKRERDYTGRFI